MRPVGAMPVDAINFVAVCNRSYWPSTATQKYRNMKARLRTHGGVATLAKTASLRCGLRLALGANPSLSLCFATSGLQYATLFYRQSGLRDEFRTTIDQPGVELHHVGAGLDFGHGVSAA